MPRYYFDLRDETGVALDEEGLELASSRAVQAEAAKSVADMARDAILSAPPAGRRQSMAIELLVCDRDLQDAIDITRSLTREQSRLG